jgi:hypothetical protein
MVADSPTISLISFNIGAIILQGPHHSAKKSTRTGLSPFIISPNVELASMFFFFFKHTEYQSSHHSKIEGAVEGTRSDFTSNFGTMKQRIKKFENPMDISVKLRFFHSS